MDGLQDGIRASHIVTGFVLFVLVFTGPFGVVNVVEPTNPPLGDGTANVTVLDAEQDQLRITEGRFGTGVWYVRLPDIVVDISDVDGRPRLVYNVDVPELGIERSTKQTVTSEGRLHLTLPDRALGSRPQKDRYTAYLEVRLQSFSEQTVVLNRTLEVTTE